MCSHGKLFVIGIGGATCGGKSTLAHLLCKLLGNRAQKLNQDDFYFPDSHPGHIFIPEVGHINWEVESAFDNAKLIETIEDKIVKSEKSVPCSSRSSGSSDSSRQKEAVASVLQRLEAAKEDLLKAKGTELSPSCQKLFESVSVPSVLVVEGIHVLTNHTLGQLCDLKVFVTLDYETCLARRKLRSYDPPDPPNYFQKIVWPAYLEYYNQLDKEDNQLHFLDGRKPIDENFASLLKIFVQKMFRD